MMAEEIFIDKINEEATEAVLQEHPELRVLWEECGWLLQEPEINGVNPVMHVLLEAVAETQYRTRQPQAVTDTVDKLMARGFSRHAARGTVAAVLAHSLYDVLAGNPFDVDAYARKVLAVAATGEKLGRNEPCFCGSGIKFKRCCLPFAGEVRPDESMGRLILGAGSYATYDYLKKSQPGDIVLTMENRVHIANFLESEGLFEEAFTLLNENVKDGEKTGMPLLQTAFQDVVMFCLNVSNFADRGLEAVEKLIELSADEDEKNSYICDKAELLAKAGSVERAAAIFDELLSSSPDWYLGHYRFALYLSEQGRKKEAIHLLKELLNKKAVDEELMLDAGILLEELERTSDEQ